MTKPQILATSIGGCSLLFAGLVLATGGMPGFFAGWISLACLLASGAYALNRPELLGKCGGRLSAWRAAPVLPYLIAFWIGSGIRARRRRFPAYNEVAPGLYVGKRLRASDLPPGIDLVIDLTGEWWEPRSVRGLDGYRSLPVLDGSVPPDEDAFLEIIDEVASCAGGVFIHCEEGKGRAPTAAAVALLARGVVDGPEAALEIVQKGRPATRLTPSDVRFVERMAARIVRAA